ncbi:diguanylate cyclase [Aliiglaciecola litoralis]|uniref:diguanylate cyclase n=1 Tax=Aliiglaciecola litoralis TaxID=582857 RepID=A0ABN1LP19_9ALTE
MFVSVLQGLSRFLNLALFPLILFFAAWLLYYWHPQLINSMFIRLPWLATISLGIAAIISWLFGRSRLVWLCILLLAVIQPNALSWIHIDGFGLGLHSFMVLMFSWLMLSKDSGFSPRNLSYSILTIITLGLISVYLLPMVSAFQPAQQILLKPSTSWLFSFWPALSQWYTATELLLVMLSGILALVFVIKRPNTSQMTLVISWLSYLLITAYANATVNHLVVSLLAIIITYAVIRDSFAMAFKDELTGVPSRRALMQKVETLGRKYTIVMSDIDHFKKFNDTYGHDVGDEVLKLVASKLSKVTGGGHAFRFGGEEFVIVYPNKIPEQVVPHIEAIRTIIADYDIALRTQPRPAKKPNSKPQKAAKNKIVKVTSSFGVAHRTKLHSDFQSVMKQADIALYEAKKSGRNCVKVAKQKGT